MDPELVALYERLSFPSALKFRRAAEVAGKTITLSAAKRFVETYSQRQVTAPDRKYTGKITANRLDGRWQADLISYVAQAVTVEEARYTNVLCVLDVFSRFMWTRALPNATAAAVTKAFKEILESSGRKPIEMNVDRGAEFSSEVFRKMLSDAGIKKLSGSGRSQRYRNSR